MPPHKYEIVTAIVITTIVFLFAGFFIMILVAYINQRKKKHLKEKQIMQSSFQEELLRTQMEIQEQTFKTISQEIHDNIGQMLSLAKMNLSKFEIDRQNSDEAVLSAKELVSQSVSSLRDLSKTLNTDTITTIGLIRSIELELQLVEKTAGVKTKMTVSGVQQKLQPQQELILFRIIQEALHNSIKHAEAKLLSVQANFSNGILELTVSDNGKGFDHSNTKTDGSGLRNMQSRTKLIGAEWKIESSPGKGTKILITIPTIHQDDNHSTGR